jgi:hypothetical protein
MATVEPIVAETAASLVRRSRAGDQNATAMLYRIGEEARKGVQRAVQAFQAVQEYLDSHPAEPFVLGSEPAVIMETPQAGSALALVESAPVTAKQIEARKPPLPRGIFDRLFDPEWAALTIIKACQYRDGLAATAVVLASGPPFTNVAVRQFGATQFGSDESTQLFFHGVRFSDDDSWNEVAPHIEPALKRCLAIGQCVGRARKIQQVRERDSSISAFSPTIGWELGE